MTSEGRWVGHNSQLKPGLALAESTVWLTSTVKNKTIVNIIANTTFLINITNNTGLFHA